MLETEKGRKIKGAYVETGERAQSLQARRPELIPSTQVKNYDRYLLRNNSGFHVHRNTCAMYMHIHTYMCINVGTHKEYIKIFNVMGPL